ncbi:MAG: hypothetical protein WC043_00985 [Pseudobdellovibrionaceae bacterium]
MKKFVIPLIAVMLVGFLGKAAWDMQQQYSGVCLDLGRPLTDEEKIRAVIKEMNRSSTRSVEFVTHKRVPFASVDDFLKANPNCCSVETRDNISGWPPQGDWAHKTNWWLSKATGVNAGYVTVNYVLHYIDEKGVVKQTPDKMIWRIQNCGVVTNH